MNKSTTNKRKTELSSYRQSVHIKNVKKRSSKGSKGENGKAESMEKTYQKEIANYRKSIMNNALSIRSSSSLAKQNRSQWDLRN